MARLSVSSCLIDGEAVARDEDGIPSFDLLRHKQDDGHAFLYAFDVVELDGEDLRREPLEQRKLTLWRMLKNEDGLHIGPGLQINEWIEGEEADGQPCFNTHARSASRVSCPSAKARATTRDGRPTG
jgi:ATP-dependent DNA ligase